MVEFQLPKLATRVRFPSLAPLLSRDRSLRYSLLVMATIMVIFLSGCATVYYPDPTPSLVARGKGIFHQVQKGETLWRIAQIYNVDIDQIIFLNNIADASLLRPGEKIFIPRTDHVVTVQHPMEVLLNDEFSWPLKGSVLSYFGSSNSGFWSQGIRIKTNSKSSITAVRQGRVVFADDLMGFGPTIIIDHQDGLMSVYANNDQLSAGLGDQVRKGQAIASLLGDENSFLYFEIRRHGAAQNPLFYLPKF